ncbi:MULTISPECIES: hypothetical protein [unclassified Nocardioides]|uniref:hypothetical protein n=1 Tax=unclassified Nocardioides TaxID=2615069 RepID=UPI00138EDD12|nr:MULTISPECIES: hypothetical protein [unclassified Nocardioides]
MGRCPECGHTAKAARTSWIARLWGVRPHCPEPAPRAESLAPDCGCTNPWHVAGT